MVCLDSLAAVVSIAAEAIVTLIHQRRSTSIGQIVHRWDLHSFLQSMMYLVSFLYLVLNQLDVCSRRKNNVFSMNDL